MSAAGAVLGHEVGAVEACGLRVEVSRRPRGHVVSLVGEAGVWDTRPLAGALAGLSRREPGLVVIDLTECRMLSSLAIATIIEFYRGVRDRGGLVRLASPSAIVQSVMHTMRLEQLFRTYDSVAEALEPSAQPAA